MSIIAIKDMMLAIADVQVFHFSDLLHSLQNRVHGNTELPL